MVRLRVGSVPEELYVELRCSAASNGRSLSAEVIDLLQLALETRRRQAAQARALEELYRHRIKPPPGYPTAEELVREDRDR
jgi:plasmid stability protein